MKNPRLQPLSFLAGAGLAGLVFAALGMGPRQVAEMWEYRIENDVDVESLSGLAGDGWEFAGYLGQGIKSADNDETLWRKKK